MIIDNLTSLPSTITTGDELPVERGTTTYKIDYNALAAAILARLGAGSDNIVDVANGGTGAATAAAARTNLGITPVNIGAVPTDLTKIDDCDDNTLTGNGEQIHFYRTDSNTLNTPYKQGLTNSSESVLFVSGNSNYTTQINYEIGKPIVYIRVKSGSGSTWNGKAWAASVTGVKGNEESNYRTGNVNLTAANIGAALVDHAYSGNVDTLFDTGMYYLQGATATGGSQLQGKMWGALFVVSNTGKNRVVQLHIGIFNDVAEFRRYEDSWSAWKTFTLTA